MAEFCKTCFLKQNHMQAEAVKVRLSKEPELCEGCGQFTRVVVSYRPRSRLFRFFSRRPPFQNK